MKKQFVATFAVKVICALGSTVLLLLLTKGLTKQDFGLIVMMQSIAMITSVVMRFGLDTALIKQIAISEKVKEQSNILFNAMLFALIACFSLVLFRGFVEATLSALYGSAFTNIFSQLLILICVQVFLGIVCAVINGLRKSSISLLFSLGLPFLVAIAGFCIVTSPNASAVAWLLVTGYSFSFLVALGYVFKVLPFDFAVRSFIYPNLSMSMMLIALSAILTQQGVQVFLAKEYDLEIVGAFALALKLSLLIAYPLQVANKVQMPNIARAFSQKKLFLVNLLLIKSQKYLSVVAFVALVVVWLFTDRVIELVQLNYEHLGTFFKVLVIAQCINIMTGPVNAVLLMCGYERLQRNITLAITLFYIMALVFLLPFYGPVSAAYILGFSIVARNLIALYFVKTKVLVNDC